ncbi:hypothetical protein LPJ64_003159 [Coemansia asiatica]|uniref:Uncharacterized protein n=1 Tax=Coemansia asiatica TaxID=1052880 RepID=A0A9W8CKB4_9FUNG|nr:hypothetical protein LPJ64_003159 [Coemansia asiatica]
MEKQLWNAKLKLQKLLRMCLAIWWQMAKTKVQQEKQHAQAQNSKQFIGPLKPASAQTDEEASLIAAACTKGFQGLNNDNKGCTYITDLSAAELHSLNFVLFDPGHCDLFYGIHETSKPDNPKVHCLTSNQHAKETQSR